MALKSGADPGVEVRGEGRRVGLAVARWNSGVTDRLLQGARAALTEAGVADDDIREVSVPGAFELPMAAAELAASDSVDCVAALGCVIRGETPHFGYVAESAALGILQAGLETGVPVTFGVLTCDDVPQAMARADLGGGPNKGADAALAALEMAALVEDLRP